MANSTIVEYLALLSKGQFDFLIGLREDDHFEAKGSAPYDLNTPQGRYELAKDVSAFANASGGLIVIGLKHRKLDAENTDEVTETTPFISSELPIGQLIGIIKTHTWPPIADLEIKWYPSEADPELGLGCIYVPPQHEDKKLFLITKVAEEGQPLKENVFGIARRVKADNIPLTHKEMHRCIGEGRTSMAQRLTRIEDKLDNLTIPRARSPGESAAMILHKRMNDFLKDN